MNCWTMGMRSRTELMFQVVMENVMQGPQAGAGGVGNFWRLVK